jgi:hypothetical protein
MSPPRESVKTTQRVRPKYGKSWWPFFFELRAGGLEEAHVVCMARVCVEQLASALYHL